MSKCKIDFILEIDARQFLHMKSNEITFIAVLFFFFKKKALQLR